jgi:hypothetical protein
MAGEARREAGAVGLQWPTETVTGPLGWGWSIGLACLQVDADGGGDVELGEDGTFTGEIRFHHGDKVAFAARI